jgi:hypothetical protein
MRIVAYDASLEPAIEAFNARLRAGGSEWEFPAGPPAPGSGGIETERYLCVDAGGVRGGYNLIRQEAQVGGTLERIGFVRLPLSEGIVNPKFAMVGALLLRDAMKRCPLAFSLGMGGIDKPLPRLYRALGATLRAVPFFFRVVNASRFLRNIRALRTSAARRRLLDLVAASRLADLPVRAYGAWKAKGARAGRVDVEVVSHFEAWADAIWSEALPAYRFLCGRRAHELNRRLPPEDARIHRLRLSCTGRAVGWAAVTDKQWADHPHFGAMRLGAFVDALTLPGFEGEAAAAATEYLIERRVDLIVTNQLHRDWIAAVARNGYREFRTSNFILAAAPPLAARVQDADPAWEQLHVNRGDGDGPINL